MTLLRDPAAIQTESAPMPVTDFDHVNVRTAQLDEMISFYAGILGLQSGARPNFPFPGAWLYLEDHALIHLVGTDSPLKAGSNLTLEHIAFRTTDLADFRAKLDAHGVDYRLSEVPGLPITQVNFFDPDGNHIHVDFDNAE